ncbi:NACHT domain-containing NTPase [Streptomyces sp. AP-93]|uniref:NACHT domain-containing protein n=1 Tax=Streptomyces sp. AP-93 TaxID=2929048 RepID=UPI001FAFA186|nr:NACHT domain-containing protein [Streptomyces sp. AP-93]MCJ0872876.1 NACHT domain-containing protein [Streptomyces sp. AP-93]
MGYEPGFEEIALEAADAAARALVRARPPGALRLRPVRQDATDRLRRAHRLVALLTNASAGLDEPARSAAVSAVGRAFAALGPKQTGVLLMAAFGPEPVPVPPPPAELGPEAEAAYRELFVLCLDGRPAGDGGSPQGDGLRAAPDAQEAAAIGEPYADPRAAPDTEAAAAAAAFDAAAAFEERYAQYVAEAQGRVQLFGLTLSQARQDWSLDRAYISLAVSGGEFLEEPGLQSSVKAEVALNATERVLLRGPAGSGKSTLVKWLALNAARNSFGPHLPDWNGLVPFVLPLRSFNSPAGLPRPQDWLGATGVPLPPPEGWITGLLASGRALVLIDGVDEVPPRLRDRTGSWLRALLTEYPAARFVVTTRHSAVPEDWLTAHGFTSLALLPMDRDDVGAFITHWHDSAREEADGEGAGREQERKLLDRYEKALLEAVGSRRDLGRLATNPLMCALLCALNRDRRMHLPRARKELYDTALDMLLIRRDSERDISGVEGVYLSRDEQTLLLQRLAYWLIRNGQVEASAEEAIGMISESLDSMPQVRAQGSAQTVFRHLLIRSGLLREPVPGSVLFVHQTFQDYLGAKAAVEARDFGVLVRNAHEYTWDNVVRMAVGHARPDERSYLLRQLLARADQSEPERSRLVLLAAACLEHAPELDPEVRREVTARTALLLPPRSPGQAEELAKAGELVLELLPEPAGLVEAEAAATIRTAALVGGDRALQVIAGFRTDDRYEAARELSDAWGRFPVDVYADTVLADAPMNTAHLHVRTPGQLRALDRLRHVRRLHVTWDGPVPPEIARRRDLESLTLHRNPRLADLSPLAGQSSLRHLGVLDCPQVTGIEVVGELRADSLAFGYLRDDLSLAPLAGAAGLRSLVIGFEPEQRRIGDVPAADSLTALHLWQGARRMTLDGIERWPLVERLTVAGSGQYRQLVRSLPLRGLTALQIRHAAPISAGALLPYERLGRLVLIRCALEGTLEALRDVPALRRLVLSECLGTVDLSPLAPLEELVIELRPGTHVTGAELIPPERLVRRD